MTPCSVGDLLLQVFVPPLKEADDDFSLALTGPARLAYIVITLTLGWPMYLVANVSGRPYDRWANHFDPYSPIFSKRERVEVSLSHTVAQRSTLKAAAGLAYSC